MLIIVSPTIKPARNALQFNTSGPDRPGPAPKFAVERTLSLQGSHRGSGHQTRASYTPGLVNVCLHAVAQSHRLTCGVRGTVISICNSIFQGHVSGRRRGGSRGNSLSRGFRRRSKAMHMMWIVCAKSLGRRGAGAKRSLPATFSVRVGRVHGRGSTSGGFVRQNRSPSDPACVPAPVSRAPR